MKVRSVAGDTVCGLLYQHLSSDDDELEARVYEMNPGLSSHGAVLPSGVVIDLPERVADAPAVSSVVSVWD